MRSHLSQAQCERQVEQWWKDDGRDNSAYCHIDEVKMVMMVGGRWLKDDGMMVMRMMVQMVVRLKVRVAGIVVSNVSGWL